VRDRGLAIEPHIALTCPHCGLSQVWVPAKPGILTGADPKRYPPDVVAMGCPVDWYFHLPLWLPIGCCGETLGAYNAAHLVFIEDYVRATVREHARGEHGWRNQALHNRLPRWMKDGKNREAVLKCVWRLRDVLIWRSRFRQNQHRHAAVRPPAWTLFGAYVVLTLAALILEALNQSGAQSAIKHGAGATAWQQ
jgi:hypothetical protein